MNCFHLDRGSNEWDESGFQDSWKCSCSFCLGNQQKGEKKNQWEEGNLFSFFLSFHSKSFGFSSNETPLIVTTSLLGSGRHPRKDGFGLDLVFHKKQTK